MTEFTIADWHSDLLEYFADDIEMHRVPGEGEFTAHEFIKALEADDTLSLSYKSAQNWLEKAVKDGDYSKRKWINENGVKTNLYKKVKDERNKKD